MKMKINQEDAAMTFGAFVMCEAAQVLLADRMRCSQDKIDTHLTNEAAMYYRQFKDGLIKATRGLAGLNEQIAGMYTQVGGVEGAFKHDQVRKCAMLMIRMYIDSRNFIHSDEQETQWDSVLFNMSSKNEPIIGSDKRNKFRLQ